MLQYRLGDLGRCRFTTNVWCAVCAFEQDSVNGGVDSGRGFLEAEGLE
jgi:hypothetical protein